MVGAFQILDVRKGQGPQAHSRGDRDDRAVFRLGGPVQQGCQLLRTERDTVTRYRPKIISQMMIADLKFDLKALKNSFQAYPLLCRTAL